MTDLENICEVQDVKDYENGRDGLYFIVDTKILSTSLGQVVFQKRNMGLLSQERNKIFCGYLMDTVKKRVPEYPFEGNTQDPADYSLRYDPNPAKTQERFRQPKNPRLRKFYLVRRVTEEADKRELAQVLRLEQKIYEVINFF